MQPARALALIEPIVSALAAAHRAGLIHRDIKPENVLIADGSGGRVKVADFGLAKAVSADTQHTATGGVIIGTVSYLAPELVVDGTSDARADVYAAGVVLYELLTGEKPHEGESPIAVAYKHVHEDVPAAVTARARHPGVRRRPGRPGHRPRPSPSARPTPACCSTSSTGSPRRWPAGSGTTRSSPPTWPCPRARRPPEPVTDDTNAFEILPIAPRDPARWPRRRRPRSGPRAPGARGATARAAASRSARPRRGRGGRAAGRSCWSSPS